MLLRASQLIDESLEGRLLAAQCLERIGDHQECLNVLGGWNDVEVQLGAQVCVGAAASAAQAHGRQPGWLRAAAACLQGQPLSQPCEFSHSYA